MSKAWDRRALLYDLREGSDFRRGVHKRALFQRIRGRTLFIAIGTGIDIKHLPANQEIIGVDNSRVMIEKSRARAELFPGRVRLIQGDAGNLSFADDTFDTVATSCTMCSVPDPARAFAELHRVLKQDGQLLMFEHVRSGNPLLGIVLDIMTLFTRRNGTQMNRDTLLAAKEGGFRILDVQPLFLDIILSVVAIKEERKCYDIQAGTGVTALSVK